MRVQINSQVGVHHWGGFGIGINEQNGVVQSAFVVYSDQFVLLNANGEGSRRHSLWWAGRRSSPTPTSGTRVLAPPRSPTVRSPTPRSKTRPSPTRRSATCRWTRSRSVTRQ
ncbi:DUF1983 domain-containing protein [Pseudomonas fulva]|nr:DUF1983 domain-containing protein [Pseudomonas fulva]